MSETTKSIVTREDIHRRLNNHFTAALPALIALGVCLAFMNLCWLADNWLFYGMAFLSDVGIVALVIGAIAEGKRRRAGEFEVVEDELVDMREELKHTGRHLTLEYVLHFRNYGSYVVTECDGSVWSYSSLGDRFYLVVG